MTKILLVPLKLSVKPHNSTPSISTEWTEVPQQQCCQVRGMFFRSAGWSDLNNVIVSPWNANLPGEPRQTKPEYFTHRLNVIFNGRPPSKCDWANFEQQLVGFCSKNLATLHSSWMMSCYGKDLVVWISVQRFVYARNIMYIKVHILCMWGLRQVGP